MVRRALPILVTVLTTTTACSLPGRLMRGYAEADAQGLELLEEDGAFAQAPPEVRGQVRFLYDDFGSLTTDGLETYAMPWKLVAGALVLHRHRIAGVPVSRRTFEGLLAEYGFLQPHRIANWTGPQPRLDAAPLGIVTGQARRGFPAVDVQVANVGCATCHAGPLHGPDGRRTDEVWLGTPNASMDLSGFADEAFQALRTELQEPDSVLAAVARVFPGVTDREISTLRKHLIPAVREELDARADRFGGLIPFENGGPGLSNGVASSSFVLGILNADARGHQRAFVQPPDLTGTTLRLSLLADGVHAPPGGSRFGRLSRGAVTGGHLHDLASITSIFVVGTQGVSPRQARAAIPRVEEIIRFVDRMESPPFPGPVDSARATEGERLYREQCASCHGTYTPGIQRPGLVEHPNHLVAQDRMGTDPVRWEEARPETLAVLESSGFGGITEAVQTGGYVAPDLSGIWASAPYLHNGSVPTLWHLLNPEMRPERFQVGGHALDYRLMGIAGETGDDGVYRYLDGYRPWARSHVFDTRERGRSNAGHEFRGLTPDEKWALIEYMKVL
jgi:mono/diheme cytochrome c family protein